MEDVAIEVELLRKSIDKQNELQDEANGIMRGLVETMQAVAQETLELREHFEKMRT